MTIFGYSFEQIEAAQQGLPLRHSVSCREPQSSAAEASPEPERHLASDEAQRSCLQRAEHYFSLYLQTGFRDYLPGAYGFLSSVGEIGDSLRERILHEVEIIS